MKRDFKDTLKKIKKKRVNVGYQIFAKKLQPLELMKNSMKTNYKPY